MKCFPKQKTLSGGEVADYLKQKGYDGIDNGVDVTVFDAKQITQNTIAEEIQTPVNGPVSQYTNTGLGTYIENEILNNNEYSTKDKLANLQIELDYAQSKVSEYSKIMDKTLTNRAAPDLEKWRKQVFNVQQVMNKLNNTIGESIQKDDDVLKIKDTKPQPKQVVDQRVAQIQETLTPKTTEEKINN